MEATVVTAIFADLVLGSVVLLKAITAPVVTVTEFALPLPHPLVE